MKTLEAHKEVHSADLEASLCYEESAEHELTTLKNKIKELESAQHNLTEELKSKNLALQLLTSDREELAKRLESIEQSSESFYGNSNQPFLLPKSSVKASTKITEPELLTGNRFAPLACDDVQTSIWEPPTTVEVVADIHRAASQAPRTTSKVTITPPELKNDRRKKVAFLSDSHGKDLYHHMNTTLGDTNIFVYSQPGAKFKQVLRSGKNLISNLNKDDIIVILAGTNDISECDVGQFTIVQGMTELLSWKSKAEVIVLDIPYRYDLPTLNDSIFYANMTIKKMISDHHGSLSVTYIPTNDALHRSSFTRHGLHLNKSGKRLLAQVLIKAIQQASQTNPSRDIEPKHNSQGQKPTFNSAADMERRSPFLLPSRDTHRSSDLDSIELCPKESCTLPTNKLQHQPRASQQPLDITPIMYLDEQDLTANESLVFSSMDNFPPIRSRKSLPTELTPVSPVLPKPSFLEGPSFSSVVK